MASEITKPASVKNFIKENSKLRVSTGAIPVMLTGLNELALTILQKAEAICQAEGRTTILERDIEAALKGLSGIESSPEGLFKVLEKMEPETVGRFSLLIAEWVKEHRKNLGIGLG